MTYQKPAHNDDNADEASSLLTIVTAAPAPSFSLGQDGEAKQKKKNGVPTMRAMIATTCFFLGTLAVLYSGGSGSRNTHRTDGTAETLLLGQKQAWQTYDPRKDYCFADNDNPGKYCWFCFDNLPDGNWKGEGGHIYNDCGDMCTEFKPTDPRGICL